MSDPTSFGIPPEIRDKIHTFALVEQDVFYKAKGSESDIAADDNDNVTAGTIPLNVGAILITEVKPNVFSKEWKRSSYMRKSTEFDNIHEDDLGADENI